MEEQISAKLRPFVVSSNQALEFKLIRKIEDLDDDEITFKPEMSHQIFGDSENIFGYKDLEIKLYFAAGSLETYLGMNYTEKVNKLMFEDLKPDDPLQAISEKLAPNVHDNIDSFIKAFSKERNFKPAGDLIYSFSVDDGEKTKYFEVYKGDMSCNKFKSYHLRLRPFVLFYIDAANYVDVDDDKWHYFNMFELYKADDGSTRYGVVGFATVYQYYAYPNCTRPRIAQILILPPFQKIGLGSHLLKAIYREYINCKEVTDITVEDPSEDFQRLRDYVDASNCSTLESFSKKNLSQGFNKIMATEAREKFKINKRQARRVYEILRLKSINKLNESEYKSYRLDVKKRLNIPYKKEETSAKRLEVSVKNKEKASSSSGSSNVTQSVSLSFHERIQALDKDYRALEEEYTKVIKRLEAA